VPNEHNAGNIYLKMGVKWWAMRVTFFDEEFEWVLSFPQSPYPDFHEVKSESMGTGNFDALFSPHNQNAASTNQIATVTNRYFTEESEDEKEEEITKKRKMDHNTY
jgi:hypothetical protein